MLFVLFEFKFYLALFQKAFSFKMVSFPLLGVDLYVPCSQSYGIYISQLIHRARVYLNGSDFGNNN